MIVAAPTKSSRRFRLLLLAAVGLWAVVSLGSVLVIAVNITGYRMVFDQLVPAVLAFAFFTLLIVFCVHLACLQRWPVAPLVGIVLSAAALVITQVLMWGDLTWAVENALARWNMAVGAWATLMPWLCLLDMARLRRRWAWVRKVAQAAALILVVIITVCFGFELLAFEEIALIFAAAILAAGAALCVLGLHWLSGTPTGERPVNTPPLLSVTCPRCGQVQHLPVGRSACGECRLVFRIELEEERCAKCGYVLYNLVADCCPECGTPRLRTQGGRGSG